MKFKQIVPADFPKLKKFFHRQRYPLSVYSLSSIIAWQNEEFRPHAFADGDTLFICGEYATHKENRHLILPVSPTREYTPEELYDIAKSFGFENYWFVPEQYLKQYGKARVKKIFKVKVQKDFEDYIYAADDLVGLKGNKYSGKRNLIHQFKRYYVNQGRVTIESVTSAFVSECHDFLEKWCVERDCDISKDFYLYCEKDAALNTVENLELFEAKGILLRIDKEVSAFGIASRLTEDMGILQFEKAFAKIKGLYQYFDQECAKRLFKGYTYINKESDMNIPGLAKAKKSYYPVMTVKSYTLTRR
ncbi:MAG: DUF2156 domain-containing protein [Proteobacteria bacterium]|nr:DUF2156 domain-containing protein [Pseudomonadota bacterium]